jgi:hypothetical protein
MEVGPAVAIRGSDYLISIFSFFESYLKINL